MSYLLLDREGHEQAGPHADVLAGSAAGGPRFLACADITGAGLTFPQPTVVRSVRALFVAGPRTDTLNSWIRALQAPPPGVLRLAEHPAQELRWQAALTQTSQAALGPDGLLIELLLEAPVTLSSLTVRLQPGPYGWVRLTAAAEPYHGEPWQLDDAADLPAYPVQQEQLPLQGDALAEQLLALGPETLENVWRLCLPYRAAALIGAVEGPIAAVNWDGGVVLEQHDGDFDRLWLKLAQPGPVPAPTQRLLDGWRPVSVVTGTAGPVELVQTALIGEGGQLHVRWLARNPGPAPVDLPALSLVAARSRLQRADNAQRVLAAVHEAVPITQTGQAVQIGALAGHLRGGLPARLSPGEEATLDLSVRLGAVSGAADLDLDQALAALRRDTDGFVRAGATLDLPDPHLQRMWRALLCHNRLFQRGGKMRYGLFPGVYQDGLFGVEEGWNILALAMYGHPRPAHELLRQTFFDAEFLKKEGQHHQYRNGLAPFYALEVLRLTGAGSLTQGATGETLEAVAQTALESARWIQGSLRSTRIEQDGDRPPYYGLMPRHTYGGDLNEPAHSLYGSSACWRGLRDAGLLLQALGHKEAEPLLEEAARSRREMWHAAARIFRHGASPAYLPFRADVAGDGLTDPPAEGDYYTLFSSLVLETALFGWRGRMSRAITDYLDETGRLVLGVARFDQWFGRLGVDAEYSRGVQLAHLHRRDFDRFYRGLLGQAGLSCDPHTFVMPETTIVRYSRQDHQDRMWELRRNPRRYESDPCSAGTAVMLHYLRYLLVLEERDEEDLPTGRLLVGAGAPAAWFQPGQGFGAARLPTGQGVLTLRCQADATRVVYDLELEGAAPTLVEVFYHDSDGRHLSEVVQVQGRAQVVLER